jgi:hypothetical protein
MQQAVLETLVVGLIVVVVALAGVLVLVMLRLRRLRADQVRAFEGVEVDVLGALARHTRRLDGLDEAVAAARTHSETVRHELMRALSRSGVVRYDAFEDAGGELSFSLALLDEHDDGVVMTSINARAGGRVYLKVITGGVGSAALSEEEAAAVPAARDGEAIRSERSVSAVKRSWRRR